MSHYGSVNDGSARRVRLRRSLVVLSLVGVSLVGCDRLGASSGPPSSDLVLKAMAAGLDAYRADDRESLENDIQTLAAQLPDDETDGAFISCSAEGYALRRIERARRELLYLDNDEVLGMGEAERYVYLQQFTEARFDQINQDGKLLLGADDARDVLHNPAAPSDFECQSTRDYEQSKTIDKRDENAIRTAARDRLRPWLISLRSRLDAQLNPQMQTAAAELAEYQLSPTSYWAPPSS